MFIRFYYYLFFRIHTLALRAQGSDAPLFAAFFLSFIEFFYVSAILLLLGKLKIVHLFPNSKIGSLLIGISIFTFNYFILVKGKRHEKILEKFQAESLAKKVRGGLFVFLLLVIGFIFFIRVALYKPGIS